MALSVDETYERLKAAVELKRFARWRFFTPYPKQQEFFRNGGPSANNGQGDDERLLIAGNRLGKTESAAYEVSRHLTGVYPPWWEGKRFDKPVIAIVAGTSGVATRDAAQGKLLGTAGDPNAWGSGMIEREALGQPAASRSAPHAIESITVKHVSGRNSMLIFKSYEQARTNWQGSTYDLLWCDEEPPMDIYTEARRGLATTKGISMMTFTPLLGPTEVVNRFLQEEVPGRSFVKMGIIDAAHFTEEDRERELHRYPAHERAARLQGDVLLGSGQVFDVAAESIMWPRLPNINHPAGWAYIWGVDFGIDHPFAAALCAFDRDTDEFFVLDGFRIAGTNAAAHAHRIKEIAANVPVTWPHDGHQREKGSGESLASLYRRHGLNMLGTHATMPDGTYSLYGSVEAMKTAMQEGKFRVNQVLTDWFQEYALYHWKDNKIVPVKDDFLSATRYAFMQRRSARKVALGSRLLPRNRPERLFARDIDDCLKDYD